MDTYWLMSNTSTWLRSKSSKKGSAASPSYAGCCPASSYTLSVRGYKILEMNRWTHHDCLPLVLDDMAWSADFIAATETEEHQLVGRVDRLLWGGGHLRGLPFGSHPGWLSEGREKRAQQSQRLLKLVNLENGLMVWLMSVYLWLIKVEGMKS